MIRLGGPGPPQVIDKSTDSQFSWFIGHQVDPNEEAKKANEAVMGNVVIFGLLVGLIRISPRILESLGISTD